MDNALQLCTPLDIARPSMLVQGFALTAPVSTDIGAPPRLLLLAKAAATTIPANGSTAFEIRASPREAVRLWSVARPVVHTAQITVHVGGVTGPAVDAQNISFGVREINFNSDRGMFLNRQHVKLRGFCDFGPFGAVGAATPDRVHLYRAQLLRSVGANSWRMAHNPPAPGRLDVMDRLGMLALDENHYYGNHGAPYGIYSPEILNQTTVDMADLVRPDTNSCIYVVHWECSISEVVEFLTIVTQVRRDRSHPSVFAWNLCVMHYVLAC